MGIASAQQTTDKNIYNGSNIPLVDSNALPLSIEGIASFYSSDYLTASGELFSNNKYTAASNILPLNTWIKVINLKNLKSVIVKVNDRMNKRMEHIGRIVDLTPISAKALDMVKEGIIPVKIILIPPPEVF